MARQAQTARNLEQQQVGTGAAAQQPLQLLLQSIEIAVGLEAEAQGMPAQAAGG